MTRPEPSQSYKASQFEKVLKSNIVNERDLRKLSWNGIPDEHRARTWKILLGYLPTNSSRSGILRRKREEYRHFASLYAQQHPSVRTDHERQLIKQVRADVQRTAPYIPLFRANRVQVSLERLLYTWSVRHPASSYVQGINDLATPLFTVSLQDYFDGLDVIELQYLDAISDDILLEVEADCYWCLNSLLSKIQDHYTPDQPGIQRMLFQMENILRRVDPELLTYLKGIGIELIHFAFRWMHCLLVREMSMKCAIRMWDTYLSESDEFDSHHVYVCAAFLHRFGHKLRTMEFEDALSALTQGVGRLPYGEFDVMDLEVVLSQAHVWRLQLKGNRPKRDICRWEQEEDIVLKIKKYQSVLSNQMSSSQSGGTMQQRDMCAEYLEETLYPISLMSDVGFLCV
mmetsp:Transcript_66117/g.97950  ORF Transcript_66117/g.97950 Transcript_66117/m.97950 type:complete len:400 (+) Transcript_66117:102-1301(+)